MDIQVDEISEIRYQGTEAQGRNQAGGHGRAMNLWSETVIACWLLSLRLQSTKNLEYRDIIIQIVLQENEP